MRRRSFGWVCALGAIGVCGAAGAQSFPIKPIRIVTSPAGGGNDFAARLVAQGLTGTLGQSVIVENRPTGFIPAETVARAQPDGYTLLVVGNSLWIQPFMQDNVPYDPVRDFTPVALLASSPNVLSVHPSTPIYSLKDLIAQAKAKPGELNYASGGTGTANHLAAELFKHMAGVNIVRVPYKGTGPAVNGLLANQVQLMFASSGSISPHVKSGRLRALAVTSSKPSALAPELPTMAGAGLPGYEVVSPDSILAPGKTPASIVNRLNQEIVRVLNMSDIKDKFLNTGVEVVASSPQEFAAFIKADMTKWGKLVKDAGIRAE